MTGLLAGCTTFDTGSYGYGYSSTTYYSSGYTPPPSYSWWQPSPPAWSPPPRWRRGDYRHHHRGRHGHHGWRPAPKPRPVKPVKPKPVIPSGNWPKWLPHSS